MPLDPFLILNRVSPCISLLCCAGAKALISGGGTTKPCGGNKNWIKDRYCDDNNNNVECQWDGGDCCNNSMSGWDNYCTACQCLDPNAQGWYGYQSPDEMFYHWLKFIKNCKNGKNLNSKSMKILSQFKRTKALINIGISFNHDQPLKYSSTIQQQHSTPIITTFLKRQFRKLRRCVLV